ncbi:MAG: hypothetical protein WCK67_03320 [bacterium]
MLARNNSYLSFSARIRIPVKNIDISQMKNIAPTDLALSVTSHAVMMPINKVVYGQGKLVNNLLLSLGEKYPFKSPSDMVSLSQELPVLKREKGFIRSVASQLESLYDGIRNFTKAIEEGVFFKYMKTDIGKVHSDVTSVDKSSHEYIPKLLNAIDVKRGLITLKNGATDLEVNLEKNKLSALVNSDEQYIFIMNHRPKESTSLFADFLTLFYKEYLSAGKAADCPRPAIIVEDSFFSRANDKMKELYKAVGFVGVDAQLFRSKGKKNETSMMELVKSFCKTQQADKAERKHIFIFPEGKMCMFNDLDMNEAFQPGIAEMVSLIARKRKAGVKVVPIGFSYKKVVSAENKELHSGIGGIEIGEPINFKYDSNTQNMLVSRGNFTPENTNKEMSEYFFSLDSSKYNCIDGELYRPLLSDGKPISPKEQSKFIGSVLLENLGVCKKEAEKKIEIAN